MQALAAARTIRPASDPLVQQHFDRSAALYVDHALDVYRRSVTQRLDLLTACAGFSETEALSVLDVGCGGGKFLDMLLERFPAAQATGIDISAQMLASNVPRARKTLQQGDALALPQSLGEFDAICVDTVMHHLIDRAGYQQTIARIRTFLQSLHRHMRPGGVVLIREIYHEYRMRAELGSRMIFQASTLNVPAFAERAMRAAGLQTANVGVCFLTRRQWQQVFAGSGFRVLGEHDHTWPGQPYRRFGFTQSGDLHFVLTRTRPQV